MTKIVSDLRVCFLNTVTKFLKWTTFDTFLRTVNFVLTFFSRRDSFPCKRWKAIFRRLKSQKSPFSWAMVIHADTNFSKLVNLSPVKFFALSRPLWIWYIKREKRSLFDLINFTGISCSWHTFLPSDLFISLEIFGLWTNSEEKFRSFSLVFNS